MATAVTTPAQPLHGRSPLVLWHLLSLDAPCVAALWTGFLAHQLEVRQSAAVPFALGLAVWMLYAADRIHDGMRGSAMEERHHFHLRHRFSFAAGAAGAAFLLFLLLFALPGHLRMAWFLLAPPLAIYLASVHLLRLPHLPKEPLVAVFFSLAVCMPLVVSRGVTREPLILVLAAFGGLCWLNCIAIARWEQALTTTDSYTAWLGRHFPAGVCFTLLLILPLLHAATRGIAMAVAMGAGCLFLLDRMRHRLDRTQLRALADAAMLSPLVVWLVPALFKGR
ncbi:MAG: hypothetical protein ACRYGF_11735 [Janthinobacterium lividum]